MLELRVRMTLEQVDLTQIPRREPLRAPAQAETETLLENVDWNLVLDSMWTPEKFLREVWKLWPTRLWTAHLYPYQPYQMKWHPRELETDWEKMEDWPIVSKSSPQTITVYEGTLEHSILCPEKLPKLTCSVCKTSLLPYSEGRSICPACSKGLQFLRREKVLDVREGEVNVAYPLRVVTQLYDFLQEEMRLLRESTGVHMNPIPEDAALPPLPPPPSRPVWLPPWKRARSQVTPY